MLPLHTSCGFFAACAAQLPELQLTETHAAAHRVRGRAGPATPSPTYPPAWPNLENNQLRGDIPLALLQKKQASELDFKFSGNQLCFNGSGVACTSPSSPAIPSHGIKTGPIYGLVLGISAAVLACVIFYWRCRRAQPSTARTTFGSQFLLQPEVLQQQGSSGPIPASPLGEVLQPSEPQSSESPRQQDVTASRLVINEPLAILDAVKEYSFEQIRNATQGFSTALGEGGFGKVYMGSFEDNCNVAIKVASKASEKETREFSTEIALLSRVHYTNLVKLLGYCKEEKLVLVYEFMSNGSLYDWLHGPAAPRSSLSWRKRLGILIDVANGINYLHHGCDPQIIHRDIKSSNILLDDVQKAKISDFGISKKRNIHESAAFSTNLMGSQGYMDPEYMYTFKLTEKVDVYSFGILLLVVVAGKEPIFAIASQQMIRIVEWIKPFIDSGAIEDMVDPLLGDQYNVLSVRKVLDVALACVRFPSTKRPPISYACSELEEALKLEARGSDANVVGYTAPRAINWDKLTFTPALVNAR